MRAQEGTQQVRGWAGPKKGARPVSGRTRARVVTPGPREADWLYQVTVRRHYLAKKALSTSSVRATRRAVTPRWL